MKPIVFKKGNKKQVVSEDSLPFVMQVANNPKVQLASKPGEKGILVGVHAMRMAGAQSEFVAANIMQAHALKSAVILRASEPPQYNKHRSPKSGVNLTKTSKQGFFKGALAEELRFSRLESNREPRPHHAKDAAHLLLKPSDPDYQYTMPLDINMRDILREIGPDGDLIVQGFDKQTGFLRLKYKDGCGPKNDIPPPDGFNGQFIINLYEGDDTPQFYSREWDKPEHDVHWDPARQVITKPVELNAVPDALYEQVFKHSFKLGYVEVDHDKFNPEDVKTAKVFANRPRSAQEFKAALGEDHPHAHLIQHCTSLEQILKELKLELSEEEAHAVILEAYTKGGSIIAGDWDGMALGHPSDLSPKFTQVFNTFAPGSEGIEQQRNLLSTADAYLEQIKAAALVKKESGAPITAFEEKALSIGNMSAIVSDFSLARAGCITAHEFVFQQILNAAYRDQSNAHYGEKYDTNALQKVMDKLLLGPSIPEKELKTEVKKMIQMELQAIKHSVSEPILNKMADHLVDNLAVARRSGQTHYMLPHLDYDTNVHDLYQHGFDMRNPYGSNLEGAWLLVSDDGGVFYGETQEQLIELLLTGDFLKKNRIDVNHGADMSAGWDRVIQKQLELKQSIPEKTMEQYALYNKSKNIDVCTSLKGQLTQLRGQKDLADKPKPEEEEEVNNRLKM